MFFAPENWFRLCAGSQSVQAKARIVLALADGGVCEVTQCFLNISVKASTGLAPLGDEK